MSTQNISGFYTIDDGGIISNDDTISWRYVVDGIEIDFGNATVANGAWSLTFQTENYNGNVVFTLNSEEYGELSTSSQDDFPIQAGPTFGTYVSPNNQSGVNLVFNYTPDTTGPSVTPQPEDIAVTFLYNEIPATTILLFLLL